MINTLGGIGVLICAVFQAFYIFGPEPFKALATLGEGIGLGFIFAGVVSDFFESS